MNTLIRYSCLFLSLLAIISTPDLLRATPVSTDLLDELVEELATEAEPMVMLTPTDGLPEELHVAIQTGVPKAEDPEVLLDWAERLAKQRLEEADRAFDEERNFSVDASPTWSGLTATAGGVSDSVVDLYHVAGESLELVRQDGAAALMDQMVIEEGATLVLKLELVVDQVVDLYGDQWERGNTSKRVAIAMRTVGYMATQFVAGEAVAGFPMSGQVVALFHAVGRDTMQLQRLVFSSAMQARLQAGLGVDLASSYSRLAFIQVRHLRDQVGRGVRRLGHRLELELQQLADDVSYFIDNYTGGPPQAAMATTAGFGVLNATDADDLAGLSRRLLASEDDPVGGGAANPMPDSFRPESNRRVTLEDARGFMSWLEEADRASGQNRVEPLIASLQRERLHWEFDRMNIMAGRQSTTIRRLRPERRPRPGELDPDPRALIDELLPRLSERQRESLHRRLRDDQPKPDMYPGTTVREVETVFEVAHIIRMDIDASPEAREYWRARGLDIADTRFYLESSESQAGSDDRWNVTEVQRFVSDEVDQVAWPAYVETRQQWSDLPEVTLPSPPRRQQTRRRQEEPPQAAVTREQILSTWEELPSSNEKSFIERYLFVEAEQEAFAGLSAQRRASAPLPYRVEGVSHNLRRGVGNRIKKLFPELDEANRKLCLGYLLENNPFGAEDLLATTAEKPSVRAVAKQIIKDIKTDEVSRAYWESRGIIQTNPEFFARGEWRPRRLERWLIDNYSQVHWDRYQGLVGRQGADSPSAAPTAAVELAPRPRRAPEIPPAAEITMPDVERLLRFVGQGIYGRHSVVRSARVERANQLVEAGPSIAEGRQLRAYLPDDRRSETLVDLAGRLRLNYPWLDGDQIARVRDLLVEQQGDVDLFQAFEYPAADATIALEAEGVRVDPDTIPEVRAVALEIRQHVEGSTAAARYWRERGFERSRRWQMRGVEDFVDRSVSQRDWLDYLEARRRWPEELEAAQQRARSQLPLLLRYQALLSNNQRTTGVDRVIERIREISGPAGAESGMALDQPLVSRSMRQLLEEVEFSIRQLQRDVENLDGVWAPLLEEIGGTVSEPHTGFVALQSEVSSLLPAPGGAVLSDAARRALNAARADLTALHWLLQRARQMQSDTADLGNRANSLTLLFRGVSEADRVDTGPVNGLKLEGGALQATTLDGLVDEVTERIRELQTAVDGELPGRWEGLDNTARQRARGLVGADDSVRRFDEVIEAELRGLRSDAGDDPVVDY